MLSIKRLLQLAIFALSLTSAVCQASIDTFTTGEDWKQRMTEREKLIALIAPTILFEKYKVPLKYTPDRYIPTIEMVISNNPYLEKEDVANIFASTVYAYEPGSRKALDWMAYEFSKTREALYIEKIRPYLLLRRDEDLAPVEDATP